jgi:hypothetical protein
VGETRYVVPVYSMRPKKAKIAHADEECVQTVADTAFPNVSQAESVGAERP